MGEKQSREAAPAGSAEAGAGSQEPDGADSGRTGGSANGSVDGADDGRLVDAVDGLGLPPLQDSVVPSESEILARLVANLGQCPERSMDLAEIRERLPKSLQKLAEDTEGIRRWLRGFPGLLEVVGEPGSEKVVLTLGRIPAPKGSEAGSVPASPLPAGNEGAPAGGSGEQDAKPAGANGGDLLVPGDLMDEAHLPSSLVGDMAAGDDDSFSPSAVQLRGLPFRATVADIRAFLGEHAVNLATGEPSIRLLLNRDGRPSGFARVQFTSLQAAQACKEALHKRQMGDRYVEVLACSERGGRARNRRAAEADMDLVASPLPGAAMTADSNDMLERERVLAECREHMRSPGRNQLLLSMLGIALSPPARNYLRRANLGLKHFLARFPSEFLVEGPKGCERVHWFGAGAMGMPMEPGMLEQQANLWAAAAGREEAMAAGMEMLVGGEPGAGGSAPSKGNEPSTPTPMAPSPSVKGLGQSGGFGVATPSDWGTPGPGMPPKEDAGGAAPPVMDFSGFGGNGCFGGNPYGWPPWGPQQWMPWQGDPMAGGAAGVPAGGKGGESATSSRRGGGAARADAPAARSHAHLHPQSHPFANKAGGPGANEGGSSASVPKEDHTKQPVAALRLRGLPFSVTVQDVFAFFAQHDVADRIADGNQAAQLLPKANGRPSGQAVVQMRSQLDAEIAQRALYNQWIGDRYIEVFAYGGEDQETTDVAPGKAPGGGARAAAEDPAGMPWPGYGGAGMQAGMDAPWGPVPPWAAGLAPPPPTGFGGAGPPGGAPGGFPLPPGPAGMPGAPEPGDADAWGALFSFLWRETGGAPAGSDGTAMPKVPPGGLPLGLPPHLAQSYLYMQQQQQAQANGAGADSAHDAPQAAPASERAVTLQV